MNLLQRIAAFAAMASLAVPAGAAPKVVIHPVQVGAETARFDQGMVMLDLERERGAVQIMPLGLDHDSVTFDVIVFNDGDAPVNFDITNIDAGVTTQKLGVFSKDELVAKAENRAMWSQIGMAVLAGAAAAAAANQRDHYRTTLYTPRGVYRAYSSGPSASGQAAAAVSVAGGAVAIASIQNRLDQTRAQLNGEIVQLTTVDPGTSYGGRIVLHKIKDKKLPQTLRVVVRWNDEEYPFEFMVAKRGTPAPAFKTLTASDSRSPRAFKQATAEAVAEAPQVQSISTEVPPPAVTPAVISAKQESPTPLR